MNRRRLLAGALVLLMPSGASAHAFAQRYDLPLPLWHYLVGAGATVGLSFVVSATFLRGGEARVPRLRFTLPKRAMTLAERVLRLFGIAAFFLLLAAGFFGEQGDWDSNLLPVTVWVVWWVGITFVSALLGDVWPLVDPWRAVGSLFEPGRQPLPWPDRVGAWPAVVLFFLFAFAELAWTENAVPRKLALVIAGYSLLTWTGMALFGVETWRRKADPFARFFGLFARCAPLAADRGEFAVRPFGAGLRQETPPSFATVAFVILALATVSFDGIAETPLWESVVGEAMGLLYRAGFVEVFGYGPASTVIKALGLVATPLVFAAIYAGVCALVGRIAQEAPGLTIRRYVLSLVPIAIAYHLAHYLSYLLVQGQAVWPLLSDPLNRGWDLFGTRRYEIDIGIVGMRFVWIFAVIAIVVGHVAATALAHVEALRTAPGRRIAIASQVPMLLLMVCYTMLSLWILSQPIVAT
ncbi:MAG: hypothetical protein ABW003_08610 [Microvirga sp.]